MSGSVTVSILHGVLEGENAAARGQNPLVVLAVGDKMVQTKALKGPGRRPAWHDSYTIDGVPLEQPLILTLTAYDVYDNGNKQLGSGEARLDTTPSEDDLVVYLHDASGRTVGHLDFHVDARPDSESEWSSPEGLGGPGTSQRGYEVKKEWAPDQASAEGPTTPPARGGRAPNVVEREYLSVPEGQAGPVCQEKTYTVVEDCPIHKERRTLVREVRRFEKQYVIETRFVAERELTHLATTEVLHTEERILSAKQSSPCEGAPELVMPEA